jgi:hypothetical protein
MNSNNNSASLNFFSFFPEGEENGNDNLNNDINCNKTINPNSININLDSTNNINMSFEKGKVFNITISQKEHIKGRIKKGYKHGVINDLLYNSKFDDYEEVSGRWEIK